MKRRHFLFVLAAALSLTGCPKPGDDTNNSSNGGEGGAIKIAVACPLTGPAAAFGEQIKMAATLKVEEINAAGGIKGQKVEVVFEDDRGDTAEAANISRKLAGDKSVCLVVGHFNSTCSNAAKEEYNRKGVLQFSPGSTNVAVCAGSPWTFRNLYRDDYQGTVLAQFASKTLGAKKAAIFFENDDYGKGLMEAFVKEAKNIGLEHLEPISFVRERTSDFKPLVEQIKGKDVDVIFISGLYNDGALITKTARQDLGITVPIIGGDGLMNEKFIEVGGESAEGAFITTPFLFEVAPDKAKAEAFLNAFKAKNNRDPDTWAALTYDAVGMALAAVEAVGADRTKIKDWMAGITTAEKAYVGITGPTYFDAEGDCFSKGAHIAEVKGGKFTASEKQLKE